MAVKPGQVYKDNDPYQVERKVRVVGPAGKAKRVRRVKGRREIVDVPLWFIESLVEGELYGRRTKVAEDRLGKTGRSGYRLVSES